VVLSYFIHGPAFDNSASVFHWLRHVILLSGSNWHGAFLYLLHILFWFISFSFVPGLRSDDCSRFTRLMKDIS
jgi:hypothetical protein